VESWGWSRHVTGSTLLTPTDKFTSVAIVRGSKEDDIYVSVNRVVDGTSYYFIERFSPRLFDQIDNAVMLDCATVSLGTFDPKDIVYGSDTVRYGYGNYGSAQYGVN